MISHDWASGRPERRQHGFDQTGAVTLMGLASSLEYLDDQASMERAHFLHGISIRHLQLLKPLLKDDRRWEGSKLLSLASVIKGPDLHALECIFNGVVRAMKYATTHQVGTIKAFTAELRGLRAPEDALSKEAEAGLKAMLALARINSSKVRLRPAPHVPMRFEVVTQRGGVAVDECWVEAVALGLLKARLQLVLERSSRKKKASRKVGQASSTGVAPSGKQAPECAESAAAPQRLAEVFG